MTEPEVPKETAFVNMEHLKVKLNILTIVE